jgi:hypothetical protein
MRLLAGFNRPGPTAARGADLPERRGGVLRLLHPNRAWELGIGGHVYSFPQQYDPLHATVAGPPLFR